MTTVAAAVPDGWRVVRLGEVADERRQRAGAERPEVYSVTKHDGFVRSADYFDRQVFSRDVSAYRLVRRGDFAYATIHLDEGSLGLFKAADAGLISPMYTVFEVDGDQVDRTFLFEYLKRPSMIQKYGRLGDGTVHRRKSIRFSSLGRLELNLPPLSEQRRIAAVLDAIDEAIERSQAVVSATEGLRRSLLHELLSEGLPERHSAWREVAGVGRVPSSWEVVRLGEVTTEPIRNGFSTGAADAPTGWWLLTLAAVSHSGFVPEATKPAPIDAHVQSFQLIPGDLLVSRSNTSERVGLAGIYRGIPENCSYPDLLMRVRVDNTRALVEFVEAALLSGRGRTYFERRARGTSGSMVKITGDILRQFPLALPPIEEQEAIVAALDAVDRSLEAARNSTSVLGSLKASLADNLLSGRVRVAGT
ncbi:MAG: restriction endonuclease subunit S [Chloroflexi bacterium]|nr:restriction endonuclease subunit S [Chloroflexota bacterium]